MPAAPSVIDLRRERASGGSRIRIARQDNPYEHLAPDERVKVIIRVLCGLVAYDEDASEATARDDQVIDARQPEATPTGV